ncbi:MAG: FAD-binding oxidoreductase [Gammaproteobacteria bacterium]|nr:FAD-binding oxidoreductase [Gammaproteobacteria bacterium]
MKLSGWGRHPVIDCAVTRARAWRDLEGLVQGDGTLIARGNGRAYGDAAVNRALTVSMLGMDRMEAFDAATGSLTCESGVLLSSIMESFVPRGWMPFVVPGTAHVTVGGMVAADVHGKNHHRDGSFGAHVESLRVLTGRGETVRCSPTENADLFHATLGGMGLTGIIRSATFRLQRIRTGWVGVETLPADDLEEAMALFEASREYAYSVAWIDCMTRGAKLGRSLVYRGTPLDGEVPRGEAREWRRPRYTPTVPLDAPTALLNGTTASLFNALYFAAGRRRKGSRPTPLGAFFFPLDRVAAWNRLYGRRGFAQYQCVLPKHESARGVRALLERVATSRSGSFLAVLKLLGEQGPGHLSFPMEGYTLALDVPVRPGTAELLDALDDITHAHGGRVYLAKDAFCRPERIRRGYPSLDRFAAVREATGGGGFASALSGRLGL